MNNTIEICFECGQKAMVVNRDRYIYHCFNCGIGGDYIKKVLDDISFILETAKKRFPKNIKLDRLEKIREQLYLNWKEFRGENEKD